MLTKKSSRTPAADQIVRAPEAESVPAAAPAGPELAFVYEPPRRLRAHPRSFWDAQPGPEWLLASAPVRRPVAIHGRTVSPRRCPTDVPDLGARGVGRLRSAFREWVNQTPRSQIVYTVIGGLCLIGAIVATIVILA